MARSLLSRKRDLAYLIYFIIHLPIMFRTSPFQNCFIYGSRCTTISDIFQNWNFNSCFIEIFSYLCSFSKFLYQARYPATKSNPPIVVDLQALYPPSIVPPFMSKITDFYRDTYKDQFFVSTPPFFKLFMWLELFYHVPTCLWTYWGLPNGRTSHF